MNARQIAKVHRFNRLIALLIGALEESYLRRDRPLSEAHVIFETGRDGAALRDLRDRLDMDAGAVSRLLRSLEGQGLVTVNSDATDPRRRLVQLTVAGQTELVAYERLSDDFAGAMLIPLDPHQRDRLLAAMAEIEGLIRTTAVCKSFRWAKPRRGNAAPPISRSARHSSKTVSIRAKPVGLQPGCDTVRGRLQHYQSHGVSPLGVRSGMPRPAERVMSAGSGTRSTADRSVA